MSDLNVANRTLAIMDNLTFLRRLNNECIDLIAIDPPFAANETFTGNPRPPISDAEYTEEIALAKAHGVEHHEGQGLTRVYDIWSWDEDVHPAWKMGIQDDYPEVFAVIQAVEACASENEAAYIAFMASRLLECRRVLKPTGSIYVHCDGHANSYLRMLMDAVFGSENYRNEIVWQRTGSHGSAKRWGPIHDTILFYGLSENYQWNRTYQDYDKSYLDQYYRVEDERGRYQLVSLTGAGIRSGDSGLHWRGINPTDSGRHWAVPANALRNAFPKINLDGLSTQEKLDLLDQAGLIYWPERGSIPRQKRYADESPGVLIQDIVDDIRPIGSQARERTGYATQKPLALYERIIRASSNPGDVVLDIFAGCATTAVAAERLGRQWIACDMAYRAWTMLKRRFYLNGIALAGTTDATKDALASVRKDRGFQEPQHQEPQQWTSSRTIGPGELPERDDVDPAPHHNLRQPRRGARQSAQSSSWSGRIPKDDAKRLLMDQFGPVCWGCGYEPRRPNGSLDETLLEVDHIRARRAAQGTQGNDELYNLALLHRTCNGIKRNQMTLEELRSHNAMNGLLYVEKISDLVDLYEATQFAAEQIAIHTATYGLQTELPQLVDNPA